MGRQQSPPTTKSVGFTLSNLGVATAAGFTAVIAPLGLSPRDFALMRAIGAAEGLSQHAIGARLGIPPSRMVAFIDGLEAGGIVQRRANPEDRRARALHLTAEGRALVAEAVTLAEGYERHLCKGLSGSDRTHLLEMLHRVGEQLGIVPGVHAGLAHPPSD
jgi:DNA-binding MarR family transcriptional regulator